MVFSLPPTDVPPAAAGEVDVWCLFYRDVLAQAQQRLSYEALLSDEERARQQAMLGEDNRRMFLATRALVRTTLSHYGDRSPQAWEFESSPRGKPQLKHMPQQGPLYFNLSNTQGLVVCAVSRQFSQLGVDVEAIGRDANFEGVARRMFAPTELAQWRARPQASQAEGFFRYWTLKESLVKATGEGISMAWRDLSFSLALGDPAFAQGLAASWRDPTLQASGDWSFAQWRIGQRFVLALSVCTQGAPTRLRLWRAQPLSGHAPKAMMAGM